MKSHLSSSWSLVKPGKTAGKSFTEIPRGAKSFRLDAKNSVNLDTVIGKTGKLKDECLLFNRFDLKQAQEMGFGCGCDWWCEILLNGKIVFSTMKEGNNTPFVTYRNHTFTAKGKKGENLLVVRTLRGSEPEKTRFNSNVLYGAEKMTELPISFMPKEVEVWKQKNSQAGFGHGGSDSYMMHIFEETLLNGGTKAPCDLKEGLRMTLPGIFACRSARNGGIPEKIFYPWDSEWSEFLSKHGNKYNLSIPGA